VSPTLRDTREAESAERAQLEAALVRAREFTAGFDSRESLKAAGQAIRLARRLKDARAEAEGLLLATTCHYQRGDYVSAVANGIDACATYRQNDLEGRSHAFSGVALAFFSVRDYKRAEEAARRAIHYAARDHESTLEATARSTLAFALAEAGRFDEALAELARARRSYRKAGDAVRMKKSSSNTGHTLRKQGHAQLAARDAEAARRSWRRAARWYGVALAIGQSRLDDAIIQGAWAECLLMLERVPESLRRVTAAQALQQPGDPKPIVASLTLWRAECERALGHWTAAERLLKETIDEADAIDNDEVSVDARVAMGRLFEARGDAVRGRQWRGDARRVAEAQVASFAEFRRQMRPLWDRFLRTED